MNSKFIDSFILFLVFFIIVPAITAILLGILRKLIGAVTDNLFIIIIIFSLLSFIGLSVSRTVNLIGQTLIIILAIILSLISSGIILRYFKKIEKKTIISYGLVLVFFTGLFNLIFPILKNYQEFNQTKVILFGVDGADWNIIDELISKGELNNISKTIKFGCKGDLIAEEPLFSPVLWTTIASGRPPAKHGLYGRVSSLNSSMIECRRIWDIAEEFGKSCGIVQFLGLYPLGDSPSAYAIPSYYEEGMQAEPEKLTFIASFVNRIRRGEITPGDFTYFLYNSLRNGMRLSTAFYLAETLCRMFTGIDCGKLEYVKFRMLVFVERLYQDVFLHINRKFPAELAIYYFPISDNAGHLYFRDYKPDSFNLDSSEVSKTMGDFIPEVYREFDRAMAKFMDEFGNNTSYFIISDHGMIPTPLDALGGQLLFDSEKKFTEYLDFGVEVEYIQGGKKLYLMTSENSDINFNDIMQILNSIKFVDSDLPLGKTCFIDGYGNKYESVPENAPRGFVEYEFNVTGDADSNLMVEFPTGTFPLGEFTVTPDKFFISGMHYRKGVFIAYGKNLKSGQYIGELRHIDILPIIMSAMGLPIAKDMSGRVPDIFNAEYRKKLPSAVETYDISPWTGIPAPDSDSLEVVNQAMERQFKALGYIK